MPPGQQNQFFGMKVSKKGINVNSAGDNNLIYKNDFSTTTWYGTGKPVVEQGLFTDNNTNGMRILDTSGNIVSQYGQQADGSINLKFFDSLGIGLAQFGKFSDGSIALKVAKSGIEVGTATNAQLIFNSSQNIFKIVATGTINLTTTTLNGVAAQYTEQLDQVTVAHNLGFVPVAFVFESNSGTYSPIPYSDTIRGGASIAYWISKFFLVSSTTLYINSSFLQFGAGTLVGDTRTYKYYLLQETAS